MAPEQEGGRSDLIGDGHQSSKVLQMRPLFLVLLVLVPVPEVVVNSSFVFVSSLPFLLLVKHPCTPFAFFYPSPHFSLSDHSCSSVLLASLSPSKTIAVTTTTTLIRVERMAQSEEAQKGNE